MNSCRKPRVLPPLVPSAVRPRFAAGAAAEASPPASPVALVLLTVLCFTSLEAWALDDMSSLQAAFLRGEYDEVVVRTRELLNRPDSAQRDELLYLQGISAVKLKSLQLASSTLQRLLEEYPNSSWILPGSVALGETYEMSGDLEKAAALYEKLLADEKSKAMRSQIAFRLGQVRQSLGQWDRSKEAFQQAAVGPDSWAASQAKELLQTGDFCFSVQLGAFKSRENAVRLKSELERRGYSAEVSETIAQGNRLYRVRVGRFSARQEAEQQAERLRNEGFPGKVVP